MPGSHEVPVAAALVAHQTQADCVVALGVLIGGDTRHHEMVGQSVSHALQTLALASGIPIINGVIVADTLAQARTRCVGKINRGAEFASAALNMAAVKKKVFIMSKALFVQRRDGRVAAMQFIYAWSMNTPVNLANDLVTFFEGCEEPREHYAFGEELIHGVIEHSADIDSRIKGLAHNWEFDRIAKIDLAILRIAMFEMVYRKDIPPSSRSMRRSICRSSSPTPTRSALSMASSID